jgi:cobalt-zinc-cadmium efflux system outer membrane protein
MLIRSWRALAFACAALLFGLARSAGSQPLSLASAIEQTLERNPDLRVYEPRLTAARARSDVAGLKPPLELQTEVQDAFGTGRASGFDTAEATFAVSQVVELGRKRARRIDEAAAHTSLIDAERAAAELDVLTEVARRFIHVAADQEQLELTARATGLAQQTLDAADARVASARAPDVELRRARIAFARAEVEHEHAEHELLSSRRKLAAMWGDSDLRFDAVTADLYALPSPGTFEALVTRLANNPDFLRFASEARLRDAELRLAQAHARSDINVTAGIKRLQDTNDEAFVFAVNVPLFPGARARSGIAEASALRAQSDAEREAHRVRAEAELFELYQELNHSVTEAQVLRTNVLPEMEAALEGTRYAYERGRYSYLEWVDAQRELVDVQRSLIDASANAHLYRAEIERLTGESLPVATEAGDRP